MLACGEDPQTPSGVDMSGPDGGGGSFSADGGVCATGASEACTCPDNTTGTRGCYQGQWGLCNCPTSQPVVVNEGTCLAGDYEGKFEGTYRSGFALGLGIPVFALDALGGPGLKFTLEQSASTDLEFPVYTVSNGVVEGVADAAFPFHGKLTGTLDCKTKKFTGELEGGYSIIVPAGINEGKFKGPVTGEYDAISHTFTFGTWKLIESDQTLAVLGETGGEGSWDAKYVGPHSP